MKQYPWLKLWSSKWLYGSGRTMTAEKRGVWIDLLALANEVKFRDGTLRFEVDSPMPRDYIAGILQLDRETLDACLAAFQGDLNTDDGQPRVKLWDDGTIELTNWGKYQPVPPKVQAAIVARKKSKKGKDTITGAAKEIAESVKKLMLLQERYGGVRYIPAEEGFMLDTESGIKVEVKESIRLLRQEIKDKEKEKKNE